MKKHSTDGVSLVFGVIFLVIAAWWSLSRLVNVDVNIPNIGWFLALGLIVVGLFGVVASLRGRSESNNGRPADAPTEITETKRVDEP